MITLNEFITLDAPALLTALFATLSCALLGNYLVLRRLSLMGDSISHSVLPGIVVAFLLTSSRGEWTVFIGAAIAGILSAILIELVRKYGRVETGAAMGVVFSIFFALGVILIEQAAARSIDLDADCLLHGQLESIFWYPPEGLSNLFSLSTLTLLPSELSMSVVTFIVVVLFVLSLFKEFKLASFDGAFADSQGYSSNFIYQILMILVACAVVASFKVVGSILVIAMLVCPAAIARFYTDRLHTQMWLSLLFAALSTVVGYYLGAFGPLLVGYEHSLSASGMMTVVAGILLVASAFVAPRYGYLSRIFRKSQLSIKVRSDDILAYLYRVLEESQKNSGTRYAAFKSSMPDMLLTIVSLIALRRRGVVSFRDGAVVLSRKGEKLAGRILRRHRLFEHYLVKEDIEKPGRAHEQAHKLEHFVDDQLEDELSKEEKLPELSPHGVKIPESS